MGEQSRYSIGPHERYQCVECFTLGKGKVVVYGEKARQAHNRVHHAETTGQGVSRTGYVRRQSKGSLV